MKVTNKLYICSECGEPKIQDTNHFGKCYSLGRFNTCPICPPFKKYPEYAGLTTWICQQMDEENVMADFRTLPLGNNFTQTHLIDAIKKDQFAMRVIEQLRFVNLPKDVRLKALLNFNYVLNVTYDLEDFLNFFS